MNHLPSLFHVCSTSVYLQSTPITTSVLFQPTLTTTSRKVKTILGNKAQKDILSGLLKKWLEQDKVNNRVAGNRRNGRLAVWSQSWWSFCKEKLAAWWDREDDHWDMTDEDDAFYHELIPTLNAIDQSTYDVEELFLAIGKIAQDKQAPIGSKRKRVSGGIAASASSSTPATALTGGDQDEGETSEEIQSRRRSNQRRIGGRSVSGASLGGDATHEDSDDAAFGYDDLYDPDEVLQEYLQETVRLRKKNNRLSTIFDKAKTSGNWGLVEEAIKQKDDDEVDEATRARLAQLRMG